VLALDIQQPNAASKTFDMPQHLKRMQENLSSENLGYKKMKES
jgi:hypothetical protein